MDHFAPAHDDFVIAASRQPTASRDAAYLPDYEAIADAERADAEAFRLA